MTHRRSFFRAVVGGITGLFGLKAMAKKPSESDLGSALRTFLGIDDRGNSVTQRIPDSQSDESFLKMVHEACENDPRHGGLMTFWRSFEDFVMPMDTGEERPEFRR